MPWVKVPVTDIVVRVLRIKHDHEKQLATPPPLAEVVLEVCMGRGGAEWQSQEFTVKVGESFLIPLMEQGNEGIGRGDTWPLEDASNGNG